MYVDANPTEQDQTLCCSIEMIDNPASIVTLRAVRTHAEFVKIYRSGQ